MLQAFTAKAMRRPLTLHTDRCLLLPLSNAITNGLAAAGTVRDRKFDFTSTSWLCCRHPARESLQLTAQTNPTAETAPRRSVPVSISHCSQNGHVSKSPTMHGSGQPGNAPRVLHTLCIVHADCLEAVTPGVIPLPLPCCTSIQIPISATVF